MARRHALRLVRPYGRLVRIVWVWCCLLSGTLRCAACALVVRVACIWLYFVLPLLVSAILFGPLLEDDLPRVGV